MGKCKCSVDAPKYYQGKHCISYNNYIYLIITEISLSALKRKGQTIFSFIANKIFAVHFRWIRIWSLCSFSLPGYFGTEPSLLDSYNTPNCNLFKIQEQKDQKSERFLDPHSIRDDATTHCYFKRKKKKKE